MLFESLGVTNSELFVLLFLGLGPVRIGLAWLNLAKELTQQERLRVSLRVLWVGLVMVLGIMVLGFLTIRNIAPQREFLVIGAAVVLIVSSLVHRSPQPSPVPGELPGQKVMRMAVYPLVIPTMINPAGLGLLMIAAAYIRDIAEYFTFFGIVALVFLINFGIMLLFGRFNKGLSVAVTQLVGEVFAILLVTLGIFFILRALSNLGVITLLIN
jgi:multiple antibiotic resistance protein